MPNIQQFRLPDAGEGLTEAEIVTWRVKPGDQVTLNQIIVEVETAKALTELPCPFAGVVTDLLVPEGETVAVGTPIIAVDTAVDTAVGTEVGTDPTAVLAAPADAPVEPGLIGGPAPGGRTSVLVGYGPRAASAVRRPRMRPSTGNVRPVATTAPLPDAPPGPVAAGGTRRPVAVEPAPATAAAAVAAAVPAAPAAAHVLAKPPVRKLARDLGVDLTLVPATGPGGIVTREDVEHAAPPAPRHGQAVGPVSRNGLPDREGAPDRDHVHDLGGRQTGGETRIPIRGVRKWTAEAMVASAFSAPHVTEWLSVDVTRTMRLVDRLREDPEFAGVRISPLLLVAKALLIAVRRNPGINAHWDDAAGEIVIRHDVNLGIAAATPRGLVVPNVKNADRMRLRELAEALAALTATARDGRTPAADLTGGTITITNVGVFGVDAGTPILNPGEAAILAFGQVRQLPWVHKGKVRPRWVTQLAVSFDHRLVDGDLGSRFLADIGAVLERPGRALVWG